MVEKKGSRRGRQGSAPGARRSRRSHALFRGRAAMARVFSQWRSKQFNIAFCVSTLIRMHIVAGTQRNFNSRTTTENGLGIPS
jgi:hypothetical protein